MIFFVIEVWLKALARGFIRGNQPLIKSSWQLLEVMLTLAAFSRDIVLASCGMNDGIRKTVAIILSMRPMRLVNRIETIHTTIASIIQTVKSLASLVAIIALLKAMYAVVGLQLFMGQFAYCADEGFEEGASRYGEEAATPTINSSSYNVNITKYWKTEPCEEWVNPTFHYDDFGNAFMSTFLFSAGGWGNTMFSAIEFVSYDHQVTVALA